MFKLYESKLTVVFNVVGVEKYSVADSLMATMNANSMHLHACYQNTVVLYSILISIQHTN